MLERCPICLGNGLVPSGLYSTTRQEEGCLRWSSSSTEPETCKSCGGKGYIELPTKEKE